MADKAKRHLRPALEIEKEVKREEISTGLHAGVEKLEGKSIGRQPVDNTHNTKYLLKQYRRVAYAVEISESELNLRMEMEHGTRLSTLEINAELAGVDLSNTKLEAHGRPPAATTVHHPVFHLWNSNPSSPPSHISRKGPSVWRP